VEGSDISSLAQARAVFTDGPRTERELIHLCSQAAVAPEELGVHVAIAAADVAERAEALLGQVQAGRIRFALPEFEPQDVHQGLVVPGPWRTPATVSSYQSEFEATYETPERVDAERAEDDPQLSLFARRVAAS
jgi:hypothetical protein